VRRRWASAPSRTNPSVVVRTERAQSAGSWTGEFLFHWAATDKAAYVIARRQIKSRRASAAVAARCERVEPELGHRHSLSAWTPPARGQQ
jgi:hypothetical protein